MYTNRREEGAPNRQVTSARRNHRVAIQRVALQRDPYTQALADAHEQGFWLGLLVGSIALALVLWLWAVPMVEQSYYSARAAEVASAHA